ncbi:hypothetical protein F2P56_012709 [Juglans regia]|uniref:Uncharacterized protein n=2 Tax=Juglans regia TaxID=51240 RepID=A0A833XJA6_JUGRE|nr:uncharacterized protein LOC108994551 [Juglans regia]KAF5468566.1 hypothetical protein F2P56_012709 [Juglans regia]
MKRQRNVVEGSNRKGATTRLMGAKPTTMSMSKKKAKREVEIKEEDVGEQRRKGSDDSASRFVAAAPENVMGWEEYCPWLGGAVDEQMSWGSFWLPFWDVEFICEAYTTFFGDVVWDDDIWNVMGIKEVPKP